MKALIIVIAVILLIALLRFGVSVRYSDGGLALTVNAGPVRLRIYPPRKKAEKSRKKPSRASVEKKPRRKAKRKAKGQETEKPGKFEAFSEILSAGLNVLNRLRKRLLIKRLTIHYVFAGDDPMKTALWYGRSTSAVSAVMPALERNFRIRRSDIRTSADFGIDKPLIYADAAISLALWESLYILLAALPVLRTVRRMSAADRKDEQDNGQTTDQ